MGTEIRLSRPQADAFRAGTLKQHRVPITPQPAVLPAHGDDLFGEPTNGADLFQWPADNTSRVSLDGMIEACPFGKAGGLVEVLECLPYSKTQRLGAVTLKAVFVSRLESITDDEIRMEGYPNWTQYAYAWNEHYARSGQPWDIDPLVWVLEL